MKMTNTYAWDETEAVKIAEELRLMRCLLERYLREKMPQMFVDYQHEKFECLDYNKCQCPKEKGK